MARKRFMFHLVVLKSHNYLHKRSGFFVVVVVVVVVLCVCVCVCCFLCVALFCCFAWILRFSGCSHVGLPFTNTEQKRFGS